MRIEYFQLIDRIVALDLSQLTIRAETLVPADHTIFEGHFPGHPLMPGVLLIETMAQTAGWLIIAHAQFERIAFLAAVKDAKLRTFVKPGDALQVSARLEHEGSGYSIAQTEISRDGKRICSAALTFTVADFPVEGLRSSMQEVARRIGLSLETPTHG